MDIHQVLIIDDDKETATLFSTVLSMVGFQCETVYSAREAFACLGARVPDLVLLDMRLGLEMGGEEILYLIRGNPRFDHTGVIVITAYSDIANLVTDMADLILLKPVEVEQLRTLVQRIGTLEIKPKYLPFRDPVTQLYNYEFFPTRLELAFERARRRKEFIYAVLAVQLHQSPEQLIPIRPELEAGVLREAADRLRRCLRPTDTVARHSGWKFLVLVEELRSTQDLKAIHSRLCEKLQLPYQVEGGVFLLSAVFGGAVQSPEYTHPGDILAAAERVLQKSIAASHSPAKAVAPLD